MNNKAPDAFRTISEVAEELDLPQHVLRFWETRFSQIKPLKRGGGRRYYRPDDVDLLRGIRHLLYGEGYTIRGAQRILKDHGIRFVQTVWQAGAPQPQMAPEDVDEGKAPEPGEATAERPRRLFGLLPSVRGHGDDVAEGPETPALRREPSIVEAPRTSPAEGREFTPAGGAPHAPPAGMTARRDDGGAMRAAAGADQRRLLEATLRDLTECRILLDTVLSEKVLARILTLDVPALLFRRGRYGVGRRKPYRAIRLRRPTPEMPAERQPEGPVEEADRVRRRACPMSHIALRAAPALSAS